MVDWRSWAPATSVQVVGRHNRGRAPPLAVLVMGYYVDTLRQHDRAAGPHRRRRRRDDWLSSRLRRQQPSRPRDPGMWHHLVLAAQCSGVIAYPQLRPAGDSSHGRDVDGVQATPGAALSPGVFERIS